MARGVLKLIAVAAIAIVIVALIALFISGYLSAFMPGGKADAEKSSKVSGISSGRSGGGVSLNATPTPSPAGQGYDNCGGMMPPQGRQAPTVHIPVYGPCNTQGQPGNGQQGYPYSVPEDIPGAGHEPAGPAQISPSTVPYTVNESSRKPVTIVAPYTPTHLPRPPFKPNIPWMSSYEIGWLSVIESLFQMLPLIFSGQYSLIPVSPGAYIIYGC